MFLAWHGLFLHIISPEPPEVIPNGPPVPHEIQKRHWTYVQVEIMAIAIITCRKDGENGDFRLIFDLKWVIFTNNITRDYLKWSSCTSWVTKEALDIHSDRYQGYSYHNRQEKKQIGGAALWRPVPFTSSDIIPVFWIILLTDRCVHVYFLCITPPRCDWWIRSAWQWPYCWFVSV